MSKLRNLDAYPKINEDFYSRTLSGGVITLASSIIMLLLFFSELRTLLSVVVFFFLSSFLFSKLILVFALPPGLYLHSVTETKLVVDTSRGETLRINVIANFLSSPINELICSFLHNYYYQLTGLCRFDSESAV